MEVHAYIGVTELQRGIEFYTRGLGLQLRRRLGNTWVELEGASVPIFLMVVSDRPQASRGHGPRISTVWPSLVRRPLDTPKTLERWSCARFKTASGDVWPT